MKEIKNVALVGRGAIGVIFGSIIHDYLGYDHTVFICDEKRKERYQKDGIIFNDQPYKFHYVSGIEEFTKADLIIIATKYNALKSAMEEIKPFVKEDTIILSTLNGIKSEEDLREVFGREKVVRCIAQKMGSLYQGNRVTAIPIGELVIGEEDLIDHENVMSLVNFFDKAHLPYTNAKDIVHDAWSKLMLNCGINQTCAAYDVNYGEVQKEGKLRDIMIETMREVQKVAKEEGVILDEDDFTFWMNAINNLSPDGMPSMRQDVLAHRPTEIGLFAGTIVPLAKKHHIDVPRNEYFLDYFGG